jgi:hypothetical protein
MKKNELNKKDIKKIVKFFKDWFKFICKNSMEYKGLPRRQDFKNVSKINGELTFDADKDIHFCNIKDNNK